MKIISFDKIKNAGITPKQCYDWVFYSILNKEDGILTAKISLKPDISGVFYNTMPSLLSNVNWGGGKIVTRYPKRTPSLDSTILLYNLETGENVAVLDGTWITAMRTGAVAAHSINLLAIDNFSEMGFIGLGNTAIATLEILLELFPKRKFKIKLRKYKNQHIMFARRFSNYENITFEYYDKYNEVINNSDVVVSAVTFFEDDICDDKYFKEGVLVVPIHTRGFTNCDLFFDKVFADDINHVKGFKYFDKFKSFAEITDIVNNNVIGRENDKERIIVYNIGISLHDIFFAGKIYDKIGDECPEFNFNKPTDKFWV